MYSFIVPCYNEGQSVEDTCKEIILALKGLKKKLDYEIIIIFDSGNIETLNKIKVIKKKNKRIKFIKNKNNLGYGGSVKRGIFFSKNKYIMWIPGDNSHPASEILKLIKRAFDFDLVSTYYPNTKSRSLFRNLFTKSYTPILNFFFKLDIPYYNGITIAKASILKNISIYTNSHNFAVEIWVKLIIKHKFSYKIIPTKLRDRQKGATAFKLKNSIKVVFNVIRLIIYFWYHKILAKI